MNNYVTLTNRLHPDLNVFILNPEAKAIQINFESNNSRLATDIVSSLISTFFQYDLDKKSQSSANILNFINDQLDTAFIQLKESEVKIQSFKDSSRVNDPTLFAQRIVQQTTELQSQLLEIEGLSFITAGTIPPNPSELIIRGNLDELLEELKQDYDLILIDNPPVGIVSDGILILNKADCPIYVFRSNYSKLVFSDHLSELINAKMVSKLFVVLNGVDIKRKGYGYGSGDYYENTGEVITGFLGRFRKI